MKKYIKNEKFLDACELAIKLRDQEALKELGELIYADYTCLRKRLREGDICRDNLFKLIRYMTVLSKKTDEFLLLLDEIRARKDEELIQFLSDKIFSPAWKKILQQDLKKIKSAE